MRSGHVAAFDAASGSRVHVAMPAAAVMIRARYDDQCSACDQPIAVGEMIAWRPGLRPLHEICPKSPRMPTRLLSETFNAHEDRAEYIAGALNDRDELRRQANT